MFHEIEIPKKTNLFYVGDGYNDFCISKKLGKNDIIFPRINYSLYKILFEQNGKKEIKAEIIPWNNGNDICEYIRNH